MSYPKMADLLPKDNDGKPLGKTVEIEYGVVDLPAWDFDRLVGGTVLRLVMGILKKMFEGHEDEFAEALLPLIEIADEGQKIELTKEALDFVVKAFAVHNRRVDKAMLSQALKPIFQDKEQTMIKTIFEEEYEAGEATGEAKSIIRTLTKRFQTITPAITEKVHALHNLHELDKLADFAYDCETLAEFEAVLSK